MPLEEVDLSLSMDAKFHEESLMAKSTALGSIQMLTNMNGTELTASLNVEAKRSQSAEDSFRSDRQSPNKIVKKPVLKQRGELS